MPSPEVERRLAAILSADAVGYTRLMATDEVATLETLTQHRTAMQQLVSQHGGRVVDSPGDNLLAEFPSANRAVLCAVEIQAALRSANAALPSDRRMPYRIGVHLGEIVVEGDRIYGDGVNVAARLESQAEPGGVCLSRKVVEEVEGRLELDFEDLGSLSVKNRPRPVPAYRVLLQGDSPVEGSAAEQVPAAAPKRRSAGRNALRAGAAAAALAALAAILIVFVQRTTETDDARSEPIRSIAVLPLESFSNETQHDYFADAMTEALIGDLAKIASLGVVSRTSVLQYVGAKKPLREIADELGVDAVVEGSVFRDGEAVRIAVQLVDARSDRHVWADSYERDLRDILALQAEVAGAIASEIRIKVSPLDSASLARAPLVVPEAYDLYLRGVHFLNSRGARNHQKAVEYLERAVTIDPEFALGWARLADAYT